MSSLESLTIIDREKEGGGRGARAPTFQIWVDPIIILKNYKKIAMRCLLDLDSEIQLYKSKLKDR